MTVSSRCCGCCCGQCGQYVFRLGVRTTRGIPWHTVGASLCSCVERVLDTSIIAYMRGHGLHRCMHKQPLGGCRSGTTRRQGCRRCRAIHVVVMMMMILIVVMLVLLFLLSVVLVSGSCVCLHGRRGTVPLAGCIAFCPPRLLRRRRDGAAVLAGAVKGRSMLLSIGLFHATQKNGTCISNGAG